jgi:hypothetical protein
MRQGQAGLGGIFTKNNIAQGFGRSMDNQAFRLQPGQKAQMPPGSTQKQPDFTSMGFMPNVSQIREVFKGLSNEEF